MAKEQIVTLEGILVEVKAKRKEKSQMVLDYLSSSRKKLVDSRIFDFPSTEMLKTEGGEIVQPDLKSSPRKKVNKALTRRKK